MKLMFYADWELALTYLKPLYYYIKEREPDWDLFCYTNEPKVLPLLGDIPFKNEKSDIAIVCDELSACVEDFKICIFHGLASKGQAFSSNRKDDFCNFKGLFAVPSNYYREKLLSLGVSDDKIFISGLTKLDGMKKNILYAPTHNHRISAIPVIKDRIYELENVKVHLHNATRLDISNDTSMLLKSYYDVHEDTQDIVDLLEWCDILIGDFGSIILEGIALGKQTYQVTNPEWVEFYLNEKKLTENEMFSLPEVELPAIYSISVYSFDDLKQKIEGVCQLGNASEKIYNKIKEMNMTIFRDSELAHKYLDGFVGYEIGGSAHNPFNIPDCRNIDVSDKITIFKEAEIKLCGTFLKVDIIADASKLPFNNETIDFILNSHVIEHIFDPIAALNEWLRVIKPDGYIFIICPHKDRTFDKDKPLTTLEELIKRHTGEIKKINTNGHCNIWNTESFKEMIDYMKLNIVEYLDVDDKVGNGFCFVIKKDSI